MPATTIRECTPEQARQWNDRYGDGYRAARGDISAGQSPRIPLVDIPAGIPGESGAQYVTRHLPDAWQIGYTKAWQFASR